jgi:hypothetical protein
MYFHTLLFLFCHETKFREILQKFRFAKAMFSFFRRNFVKKFGKRNETKFLLHISIYTYMHICPHMCEKTCKCTYMLIPHVLNVFAACPCHISLLHVHAACPRFKLFGFVSSFCIFKIVNFLIQKFLT